MTDPTTAALARATPRRRERDVQAAILVAMRAHGVACWKVGSGAFRVGDRYVRMGHKGMADIIGLVAYTENARPETQGRFVAVEVKAPGKRATKEQAAFLDTVRRAGGLGIVASSVDDVAAALGWGR